MKISEIIKDSATLLAREDVVKYLSNKSTLNVTHETLETVNLLTRLSNLVIRELAEGLILMKKEVNVFGKTSVNFAELGIEPLDIIAVYDENGNKLKFNKGAYGITANGSLIYKIVYSYLPNNYDLNDTVGEFEKSINSAVLAYGVCAEFCLVEARFDEAFMWNDKYVNGVHALIKPKNGRVKGRNFV